MSNKGMKKIYGKVYIEATMKLETGLHIGGGSDFSAIGAVDNVIVRDTVTKQPYVPGSSLKGKMRHVLVRSEVGGDQDNMPSIKNDSYEVKRLFGASNPVVLSRLQFFDVFLTEDSAIKLSKRSEGLYMTEIKFENTIDRQSVIATPRQLERIPRGAEFKFKLVYNVEDLDDLNKDFQNIKNMFKLLEDDYLGGGGTRGSGRVKFKNFKTEINVYREDLDAQTIREKIGEAEKEYLKVE